MRVPTDQRHTAARTEVRPGVWLDSRLAVWLQAQRALVLADLHWGYAASHRVRGNLLPAWGDEEIAARLHSLIGDYAPAEVLWLGDVVHAAEGAAAAESFLQICPVPVTLISGNHDRRWQRGMVPSVIREPFFLHHGDILRSYPAGLTEVIGHHHPAVSWSDGAGGQVKLPALISAPNRLVLPAFSPWAAGTSCTDLLTPDSQLWAIAPKRIFAVRVPDCASVAV